MEKKKSNLEVIAEVLGEIVIGTVVPGSILRFTKKLEKSTPFKSEYDRIYAYTMISGLEVAKIVLFYSMYKEFIK